MSFTPIEVDLEVDGGEDIELGLDAAYNVTTDKHYVHTQSVAASVWTITHNLDKYPSVTVVDSGENVVVGDVQYIDRNSLTVAFNGAFSGKAYLN